jgi:hypothetical protein
MTPVNFDKHLVKTLLSTFQHHYPERLAKLFLFPKNMMLSVGLNVAKVFVDSATMEKVHILHEDEVTDILPQYISKKCLFRSLGGDCDDPWHFDNDGTRNHPVKTKDSLTPTRRLSRKSIDK